MAFDLTHARHDPMHCLVPGLFRSLKRGERKKLKLDVTYHYAENEQARFVGFEPLGADDMRLLQGLVALGGPKGIILTPEPTADLPKQLRLFLEPKFDAVGQDALVVRESMTSLLAEIGLTDGGDNIRAIKACLLRMANVTVVVTTGSRQPEFDSYARKCLFLLERTFKNATTTAPTAPAPLVFRFLMHETPRSVPC